MINYTVMPVVRAREIEKEVKRKYNKNINLASTMWPGDYMNDCYKRLCFSDAAVAENKEEQNDCPDEEIFQEREMVYAVVRDAFSLELSLGQDTVLVDISW